MLRTVAPFAFLLLTAPAAAASFDCAKAGTKVEKLICATPELGELDERMAAAFAEIGPEPQPEKSWGHWGPRLDDQRRWLHDVRDRCRDAACLRKAYLARIEVLGRWHDPAPVDAALSGRYVVEKTVALVGGEDPQLVGGNDCLSLLPRADGDFDLSIESIQTNAHSCSVTGIVRADGQGLRLVAGSTAEGGDDECALRLVVEQGELRVEDADATCRAWCGARARLDGLRFPRSMKETRVAASCDVFEDR
jgi:uncharacterized protein